MKTCKKCGETNQDLAKFCAKCGASLEENMPEQAPMQNAQVQMKICPKCGSQYAGNFCPNGCNSAAVQQTAPKKKLKGWQIALIVVGGILAVGVMIGVFGQADETIDTSSNQSKITASSVVPSSANKTESKPTSSISAEQAKTQYISSCKSYDYKSIARDPGKYKGKYAKLTGQVSQVLESGSTVVLRVNVTKGEYDIWTDTVYVEYLRLNADESRILEDDIVTIYGQLDGIETYTAVLGNEISIPRINAKYIALAD